MEAGEASTGSLVQAPSGRSSRTNRVGDPRSSENRPDRLSLAHSSLRRSTRGVSVCRPVGCRGSGRALWRRAIRHRGCLLEPSRRHLHVRHHGRGVRIRNPALLRLATMVRGADTARPEFRRKLPVCSRHPWASLACMRTILSSSKPDAALRRLLSLVPRCHRRDA